MIHINLAPIIKEESKLQKYAVPLIMICACLGLGYYLPKMIADFIQGQVRDVEERIVSKQLNLERLNIDLKKVQDIQSGIKELEQRRKNVEDLARARKQPVAVLNQIQLLHLERMYFNELSFQNGLLNIKGWANDNNLLSEYVKSLKLVSSSNGEDLTKLMEYAPELLAEGKAEKIIDSMPLVEPVFFSNVNLKFSSIITVGKNKIQSFEIDFAANIPIANHVAQQ